MQYELEHAPSTASRLSLVINRDEVESLIRQPVSKLMILIDLLNLTLTCSDAGSSHHNQ